MNLKQLWDRLQTFPSELIFFHSEGWLWELPTLFLHIRIEMSENNPGYPLVSQQFKGNPKAFKCMQTLSMFAPEKTGIWLKCQETCCSTTQGTHSRVLEILTWSKPWHFCRGKKKRLELMWRRNKFRNSYMKTGSVSLMTAVVYPPSLDQIWSPLKYRNSFQWLVQHLDQACACHLS